MIPYLHTYRYIGFAFISGIRPNLDLFSNSLFTHISYLRLHKNPFIYV
jgi:hypothetical protein